MAIPHLSESAATDTIVFQPLPGDQPVPYALLLDADPWRERVDQYLAEGVTLTACINDVLIGIAVYTRTDEETFEIRNIAVAPAWQNRGIGTRLLRAVEIRVREAGARRLVIATSNASIGPLFLYQREGFDLVALHTNYFTKHYPEPMVDDGIPVRHQLVLQKELC